MEMAWKKHTKSKWRYRQTARGGSVTTNHQYRPRSKHLLLQHAKRDYPMKLSTKEYTKFLLLLLIPIIFQVLGNWLFSGWYLLPLTAEVQDSFYEHRGALEVPNHHLLTFTAKETP